MTEPLLPRLSSLFSLSFTHAPEVPTREFLTACTELVHIFDGMGAAFSLVKNDMGGNISALEKRYAEDPAKFRTLELIVQEDIARKVTESGSSATCKLLWLKRALQYIVVFLGECVKNEEKDLSKSAQKAYDETLARVHGFIVRGTFFVAMKMAPKREEFLRSFGDDEKKVLEEMKVFTETFNPQVDLVVKMYDRLGLENDKKV